MRQALVLVALLAGTGPARADEAGPAAELARMLDGRLGRPRAEITSTTGDRATLRVEVGVIDPDRAIREVTFRFMTVERGTKPVDTLAGRASRSGRSRSRARWRRPCSGRTNPRARCSSRRSRPAGRSGR